LEYTVLVYLHNACIVSATNIKMHLTDKRAFACKHELRLRLL